MTTPARLAIVAGALAVAVVAFFALRPADDDEPQPAASTTPAETTASAPSTQQADPSEDEATEQEPAAPAAPPAIRIRVRGGEPVGGIREVRAEKGDRVRLRVTSDQADEAHLHGYDIERPVGPGQSGRFSFTADVEGIFELELHETQTQIASVRVDP